MMPDPINSKDANAAPNQRADMKYIIAIWLLPWAIMLLAFSFSRETIMVLFTNRMGQLAIVGLLIWETIGCSLLQRGTPAPTYFGRPYFHSARNVVIVLVFVAPILVLTMLGPVAITLLEAGK
jgi:hypothetical protein